MARDKAFADRVRWVHGDARAVPADLATSVDLVTMTGNAAQAIVDAADWDATLAAAAAALRPAGHVVLESRDPAFRGWTEWTPEHTRQRRDVPGTGVVETWTELVEVALPLVTFRTTWVFAADGATLTSTSTLRLREQHELVESLQQNGFEVVDARDAPDRPGRELVVLARVTVS